MTLFSLELDCGPNTFSYQLITLLTMLGLELVELIVLLVVMLQSRQCGIEIEREEVEDELVEGVAQGCISVVVFHTVESRVEVICGSDPKLAS